MAARPTLIFPVDANALPPFLLGMQAVPTWDDVLTTIPFDDNDDIDESWNIEDTWNCYATALLRGMPFNMHDLDCLLLWSKFQDKASWNHTAIKIMAWVAKNIHIADYSGFIALFDWQRESNELFVEAIETLISRGMRLTLAQIEECSSWSFNMMGVLLRLMFKHNVLDPAVDTDYSVTSVMINDNDVLKDLIRVIYIDRKCSVPDIFSCVRSEYFFENILPQLYMANLHPVGRFDYYINYKKEATPFMKYAMLASNMVYDIDELKFDDPVMKLEFKRKENKLITLCDFLPVEIVHKIAGMTGIRSLARPMMLKRMIERQATAMDVIVVE